MRAGSGALPAGVSVRLGRRSGGLAIMAGSPQLCKTAGPEAERPANERTNKRESPRTETQGGVFAKER